MRRVSMRALSRVLVRSITFFALLTFFSLLNVASTSEAALLGLTQAFPDIATFSSLIDYDGAGHLTVTGEASTYSPDSNPLNTLNIGGARSYSIDMYVGPAGEAIGGTLTILGTISELGANSGTLLVANLWYFGFEDSPDPYNNFTNEFEFQFNPYAGDLAANFQQLAGVQLHVGYSNMYDANTNPTGTQFPFTGDFSQPFTNELFFEDVRYGDANSDTFASVPEPSSVVLLALGFLGLAWRQFRRTRSEA